MGARWHFWVSIAAVALFGFSMSRDSLARLAWQRYGRADIAIALNRGDAALAMRLGNFYFNGGAYDLEKAERAYRKALAAQPDIPQGHYQLARIAFLRGDLNAALQEINQELKNNPGNGRSFYVRGLIYGFRDLPGDLPLAEADFKRFIEWAPQEWASYNDLAWVLLKQGKYRETKEILARAFAIVLPPAHDNPWLLNSLGVAQLNLGEYAEAMKSFQEAKVTALALTPEDWQRAHPGAHPESIQGGLRAFLGAIEQNLQKSLASGK